MVVNNKHGNIKCMIPVDRIVLIIAKKSSLDSDEWISFSLL